MEGTDDCVNAQGTRVVGHSLGTLADAAASNSQATWVVYRQPPVSQLTSLLKGPAIRSLTEQHPPQRHHRLGAALSALRKLPTNFFYNISPLECVLLLVLPEGGRCLSRPAHGKPSAQECRLGLPCAGQSNV